MELEGSLPHSQVSATCPCPEPDQSSQCHPLSHFLKIRLSIILPSTPGSSKCFLSLRFLYENPVSPLLLPIRATCPAQLILDVITRPIFGEQYRSVLYHKRDFLTSGATIRVCILKDCAPWSVGKLRLYRQCESDCIHLM